MSRPKNDAFLRALLKEPTDFTPLWMMRQAGRYLPEYCATRKRAGNFLNLCKSPSMACEVTLQPLARYDLDAAILFSDILIPMEAMNLDLDFHEGRGPVFAQPVRSRQAVEALVVPDPEAAVPFVMETIRLLRRELKVPLIGFAGDIGHFEIDWIFLLKKECYNQNIENMRF